MDVAAGRSLAVTGSPRTGRRRRAAREGARGEVKGIQPGKAIYAM
jgi:hypothetical protein